MNLPIPTNTNLPNHLEAAISRMTLWPRQFWILTGLFYLALLGYVPLIDPDEGRYAVIAQEMLQSGQWLTPHLNGTLYFEKPPLVYWLTAGSLWLLGYNEFAARLVPALFSLLTVWLTYRLARTMFSTTTAAYSAMVLAVSLFHFVIGRLLTLDMAVAFFITWSVYGCYQYGETGQRYQLYLAYLASGLAVMTKGLIGMVLPAAVVIAYFLCSWQIKKTYRLLSPVGFFIFLAITLPWYLFMTLHYPGSTSPVGSGGFFDFFIIHHHFQRYTTGLSHEESWWYFIPVALTGLLPFLLLLPRMVATLWSQSRPDTTGYRKATAFWAVIFAEKKYLFLFLWSGIILAFFSTSQSKLIPYIAPCFPPLAILVGAVCHRWVECLPQNSLKYSLLEGLAFGGMLVAMVIIPLLSHLLLAQTIWWTGVALMTPFILALTILPFYRLPPARYLQAIFVLWGTALSLSPLLVSAFIYSYKSGKEIALAARPYLAASPTVVHLGFYCRSFVFYTQAWASHRPIIVDHEGELAYGIHKLPDDQRRQHFLTLEQFRNRWASSERLLCLYRSKKLRKPDGQLQARQELQEMVPGKIFYLEWRGEFCLFSNQPWETGSK